MSRTINFYGRSMPYFEFSNFYRAPIVIDGVTWKTSEHYFQAMKFDGHPEHVQAVKEAGTPMMAARTGRDSNRPKRQEWDDVRDDVMYKALYAKFTQYEDLKKLLLDTGDAVLVEHTVNDCYWGDGGDGTGKNMLGKLLMKLRENLKEENEENNYLQKVTERAIEVFGTEQKAQEWIEKKSATLGDNPKALCSTEAGFNNVMRHLLWVEMHLE